MIQILLTKYWVLAHLLVTAGTLCYFPMTSSVMGIWCAVSLFVMMFSLPPVHKGESFWLARLRVSQAVWRDVVLYAGLLVFLYVGCQVANGPRALVYEPELRRWLFAPPSWESAPSSVNPEQGIPFFVGLVAGIAAAMVIRNALPRKQSLYLLLGWGALGGLLILGGLFTMLFTGNMPTWTWLGGAFGVGVLCVLLFCVQLGIALEAFLEGHRKTLVWALSAALLAEIGALAFGTISVKLLITLLTVFYLILATFIVNGGGRFPKVLWAAVMLGSVMFAYGVGLALMSGAEVTYLFTPSMWTDQYVTFCDQWSFRAGLSLDIFTDAPMLGAGPAALEHFAEMHLETKTDWVLWKQGGTAPMCDLLTLLSQCGMIGTVLLLIPGGALFGRCLMQFVEYLSSRASPHRIRYSFRYLFVLFGSVTGVISVLLLSFVGTPLHTPAILVSFLIVSACMAEWMPRQR